VIVKPEAWPQCESDFHRLAAMNSFGAGGANVHCIMSGHPPPQEVPVEKSHHLLPIAAHSTFALQKLATAYLELLKNGNLFLCFEQSLTNALQDPTSMMSATMQHEGGRIINRIVLRSWESLPLTYRLVLLHGYKIKISLHGPNCFPFSFLDVTSMPKRLPPAILSIPRIVRGLT
jgi:hypothetical protein